VAVVVAEVEAVEPAEVVVQVRPEALLPQLLRVEPQMLPLQREVKASPLVVAVPARVVAVVAVVAVVEVVAAMHHLFRLRLRSNWWIFA
jgi:hypothetical protein